MVKIFLFLFHLGIEVKHQYTSGSTVCFQTTNLESYFSTQSLHPNPRLTDLRFFDNLSSTFQVTLSILQPHFFRTMNYWWWHFFQHF